MPAFGISHAGISLPPFLQRFEVSSVGTCKYPLENSAHLVKKRILLVVGIFSATLIIVPQVSATDIITVSVDPTSCTLAPLAGITSCGSAGSMNSDTSNSRECLYETYNGNYLAVSVTLKNIGSPTGQHSNGPLTTDNQCRDNAVDIGFNFTVSYIAQSCVSGTYPVNFTATKGGYSNSTIFDAYVRCFATPV